MQRRKEESLFMADCYSIIKSTLSTASLCLAYTGQRTVFGLGEQRCGRKTEAHRWAPILKNSCFPESKIRECKVDHSEHEACDEPPHDLFVTMSSKMQSGLYDTRLHVDCPETIAQRYLQSRVSQ